MTRAEWAVLAAVVAASAMVVRDILATPPHPPSTAASPAREPPPEPPAPEPPALPAPAPQADASQLKPGEKFCAEGGDESFTIRHTIGAWLEDNGGDAEKGRLRDLLLAAQSARRAGDFHKHRVSMKEAYALAPNEPAVAWATADAFRLSPEPRLAAAALRRYLAAAGDEPALSRLASRLEVEADIVKDYVRLDLGELTLQYPRDEVTEEEATALLRRAAGIVDEAARVLASPRRTALTIVLTPGREEILAMTCVRAWAEAVFDGKLRIAIDRTKGLVSEGVLRHEALHAVMADAAKGAPFWFNEGVAQWFAHEQDRVRKPWRLMHDNGTFIPFASLEGTFQAFESKDDVALAYAQSLFMVHWVLDAAGPDALPRAAAMYRGGADTPQVLASLVGAGAQGESLLRFLRSRGEPQTWPR